MSRPRAGVPAMLRIPYLRYVAASAVSLGVDLALFLAALSAGMPAALASGFGYSAGIVAHWWLSSRAVFVDGVAADADARRRQQALFLGSAIVGLGVTMAVVGLGAALGLDPRLAKLAAILVSFHAVWLLRRHIVFAR